MVHLGKLNPGQGLAFLFGCLIFFIFSQASSDIITALLVQSFNAIVVFTYKSHPIIVSTTIYTRNIFLPKNLRNVGPILEQGLTQSFFSPFKCLCVVVQDLDEWEDVIVVVAKQSDETSEQMKTKVSCR